LTVTDEQETIERGLRDVMETLRAPLQTLRDKYQIDIEARDDDGRITLTVQIAHFPKRDTAVDQAIED
jgi:hypothetical protein